MAATPAAMTLLRLLETFVQLLSSKFFISGIADTAGNAVNEIPKATARLCSAG
jgi:hypothetical protein